MILKNVAMSRQLILALNTEMTEKHYFIEHTEDYLYVFVWAAPGTHTLTLSNMHILQVVYKMIPFMTFFFY